MYTSSCRDDPILHQSGRLKRYHGPFHHCHQASESKKTIIKNSHQVLDYLATNPDATIHFMHQT